MSSSVLICRVIFVWEVSASPKEIPVTCLYVHSSVVTGAAISKYPFPSTRITWILSICVQNGFSSPLLHLYILKFTSLFWFNRIIVCKSSTGYNSPSLFNDLSQINILSCYTEPSMFTINWLILWQHAPYRTITERQAAASA